MGWLSDIKDEAKEWGKAVGQAAGEAGDSVATAVTGNSEKTDDNKKN